MGDCHNPTGKSVLNAVSAVAVDHLRISVATLRTESAAVQQEAPQTDFIQKLLNKEIPVGSGWVPLVFFEALFRICIFVICICTCIMIFKHVYRYIHNGVYLLHSICCNMNYTYTYISSYICSRSLLPLPRYPWSWYPPSPSGGVGGCRYCIGNI